MQLTFHCCFLSFLAPILFAKACESQSIHQVPGDRQISPACNILFLAVFIAELTSRAWLVASAHKRRTLSRADIAKAIAKSDQFDFLIDIVPRELAHEKGRSGARHRVGEGHGEEDHDIEQDPEGGDEAEEAEMDAGEEVDHEIQSA